VVDVCGNESELSDHHKTMHLTMNLGLDSVVNLIWDHYEGFMVDQYKIRRYDAQTGWMNLADIPSNLTSRTDENPPKEDLTYYIEIFHPTECTATEKKAATLNSSRSNRITRLKSTVGGTEEFVNRVGLQIYPNPGTGVYNIEIYTEGAGNFSVRVSDLSGKQVLTREYKNIPAEFETQLDLTGYSDGIYILQVRTGNSLLHRILIKE
jgi:hypothetical protein